MRALQRKFGVKSSESPERLIEHCTSDEKRIIAFYLRRIGELRTRISLYTPALQDLLQGVDSEAKKERIRKLIDEICIRGSVTMQKGKREHVCTVNKEELELHPEALEHYYKSKSYVFTLLLQELQHANIDHQKFVEASTAVLKPLSSHNEAVLRHIESVLPEENVQDLLSLIALRRQIATAFKSTLDSEISSDTTSWLRSKQRNFYERVRNYSLLDPGCTLDKARSNHAQDVDALREIGLDYTSVQPRYESGDEGVFLSRTDRSYFREWQHLLNDTRGYSTYESDLVSSTTLDAPPLTEGTPMVSGNTKSTPEERQESASTASHETWSLPLRRTTIARVTFATLMAMAAVLGYEYAETTKRGAKKEEHTASSIDAPDVFERSRSLMTPESLVDGVEKKYPVVDERKVMESSLAQKESPQHSQHIFRARRASESPGIFSLHPSPSVFTRTQLPVEVRDPILFASSQLGESHMAMDVLHPPDLQIRKNTHADGPALQRSNEVVLSDFVPSLIASGNARVRRAIEKRQMVSTEDDPLSLPAHNAYEKQQIVRAPDVSDLSISDSRDQGNAQTAKKQLVALKEKLQALLEQSRDEGLTTEQKKQLVHRIRAIMNSVRSLEENEDE